MLKVITFFIMLFLFIIALVLYYLDFNNKISVKGFRAIDGDTIEYNGVKYRAYLMDTPEKNVQKYYRYEIKNHTCLAKYAIVAEEYLNNSLTHIKPIGKNDKYGRKLALFYQNDKILDYEMVRLGLAFCYYRERSFPEASKCLDYEEKAKEEKLGLWSCNYN